MPSLHALHELATSSQWSVSPIDPQGAGYSAACCTSDQEGRPRARAARASTREGQRRNVRSVASRALSRRGARWSAYGRILPAEVLAIPKHGCVNVHASLLPATPRSRADQLGHSRGRQPHGHHADRNGRGHGHRAHARHVRDRHRLRRKLRGVSLTVSLTMGAGLVREKLELSSRERFHRTRKTTRSPPPRRCSRKNSADSTGNVQRFPCTTTCADCNRGPSRTRTSARGASSCTRPRWMEHQLCSQELPGEVVALTKDRLWVATGEGALGLVEVQSEKEKNARRCESFSQDIPCEWARFWADRRG